MSARAGFHLSVCAMLPWIKPILIGVPLVSSLPASRMPPQTDTSAISASVPPAAIRRAAIRRRGERSADLRPPPQSPRSRTRRTARDRRRRAALASCAIGSSVTIVLPSGIHGKPPKMMPRRYSIETHAAGARHSPPMPNRRVRIADDRADHGDVGRHVEREQRRDDHGHEHRQAAKRRHRGAGPIHRAREVNEAGDQSER